MTKKENIFTQRKSQSPTLISHLGALLAVTVWGISFINTKILLEAGVTAVEIAVYRFLIAYLCILLICPRPMFAHSLRDELKFLLVGICGSSLYFIAENTAMKYTLVSNVSLIVAAAPIITALLMGAVYKTDRPTRGFMLGSFIALVGVGCVIFNSSFQLSLNPLGDMLALLAALCWAVYSILLRPLNATYSVWLITRKLFFYGLITALPFLALEPHLTPLDTMLTLPVLFNLAFLAVVCSVAAFALWAWCTKRLGVVKTGIYLYISPIVTLLASIFYLGEQVSVVGITGCVLIILGMVLSDKLGQRR